MNYNAITPTSFDQLVFQTDIARKKLEKFATGATTGNILLHGPFGSSKSTTAKVVANEVASRGSSIFETDVLALNGGSFEPDDLKRVKANWHMSGNSYAYAVFDEFDLLSTQHQAKVRATMDEYDGMYGFIFTTNHLHRVDGAIQSRCEIIEMPALDPQNLLPLCRRFLSQARIELSDEDVLKAIEYEAGDIRKVLRQLERIVLEVRERTAA